MKILKRILLVLVAIVVLALIVAAFSKKEYAVEREVIIKKSNAEVFDYVKYLKNQNEFNKWANQDPQMKKEFKGTDGTVGCVSRWESKDDEVGTGEETIVKIEDGKRIDYALHFIKPFEAKANSYMSTEALGTEETKVKWGMNSKMPYPMNLMLLFMDMDKMLGDDLQFSLNTLKQKMEKNNS